MTRKDFEALASIIRNRMTGATAQERNTLRFVAGNMCEYLSTTNPRFDRARFMHACGL